MDRTALVSLGNQVVVIGLDGELRVLTEGQQPLPGEVVVATTDAAPLNLSIQLTEEQSSKDISDDVARIIGAIEQGQDPSIVDEELAPAAGENSGSSLQNSATIARDGTEVLASTNFETIGLESLGLSETQALTLNDFFATNIETSGDGSNKPLTNSPVTLSAIEEDSDPITITTEELLSNVDIDDADTLIVTNVTIESGNGTLIDNNDGSWTYIPEADDDTEVSFSYDIIDDDGGVINGTANLDIKPVNDAPIATNDAIKTDEDSQVVIDVLANDSDIEGDDLSITSASVSEKQGIVEIVDGKLVFTPAENFNGNATINYTISDGELEDEAQVSVTVNSVNDAPIALNDATITEEDTSVTIDVLPNDTDIDGDALSIESASVPSDQGQVEIIDGKLVFTPTENFNGDAEITYTVTDGALTDESTVKVTVNAVNDTPVVESSIADQTLAEDFTPYTIDLNTAFSDVDNVDGELSFSVSGNSNVNVSIENGIATISPTADWNGSEELMFTATDPSGESASQTVNFTVAPVADIESDRATVVEDTPTIIKLLGNDTFEGDDKVVSLDTNNGPANGTVSVNPDGSVTYTPNDNYHGADSFTYIVTSGGVSESTTVNVDVTPVNDAPVAKDDTAVTDEDTPVTIDVLPNDTDIDGDTLSIQSASVPEAQGTVEIIDGKLVFTPAENFNDDAEITYTITDGSLTDQATVNVTVNAVNDTPVVESNLADQTLAEDFTPYSIDLNTAFSDVDNVDGELSFSVSGNNNVLVSIENGIATISPTADWNGSEALTFTATDPSGESVSQTVNFTVAPVADIVADNATVVEDTPTIIKVLGNDTFEGNDKVVSLDTNNGPANGTVSVNPDGSVTYTPNDNYHGADSFTYIVTSGGVSESTTVNVDVTPVNDAPVATNDNAVTDEDTPVTIDVLPNDTDIDGDKLSIDSASVPSDQGTVEIVDGKLVFTPAENFNGDAEITYTVTDGTLTDQATVNVTVNAVNDTPEVESNIADQTLAEDFTPYTIDLNVAFSDVDNVDSDLTFSVSGNSNVNVSIENGIATITPTADWNGKETITFTAKDPSGESVSQTVNFTVAPVADIVADKATVVEDTPTIIKVLGNDTFEGTDKVVSLDTNNGPANGTVSVNPDGSVTYTPNDNYYGLDSFTYIVTSGGVSESTTVNVDVTSVNDAPVAKDDIATTQEDTAVTIDVLTNDNDVDGDKLSIESASVPKEQGTVEVVDGKLVFTPAENFNGDAEITYIVTDGQLTDEAKVTVTVNPVNDAPTIKVDAVESITEDAVSTDTVVATLTVHDTDTPEDELTVLLENNSNGYFVLVGNEVKLTQAGVDAINNDELNLKDLTISASVSDGVNPTASDSDSLIVNRVNDAPTIKVDAVESITEDAVSTDTVVATLTVRDTDTPEDQLTVSLENNSNGYFVLVGNEVKLTQEGVDAVNNDELNLKDLTISASVSDGLNPTANDSDSLIVNRVNDAPTVENAIADQELSEDFATYTIDLNDAFKDSDSALNFSVSGNSNVLVSIENGIATISPTADWNGSETLTFTATDPSGESISQTVNFTVAPVADIVADKATVVEDTLTIIKVLGNDTFEGDDKVVSLDTNNGPANGTVSVNPDGSVTYTPNDNYVGKDTFTYIVTSGGVSESTTVEVNVTPVNDAPVAKDDIATTQEDTAVTIDVLPNDTDVDGDKLSIQSASVPEAQGKVEIVDGKLVFTPAENFNGHAEIIYTVTDGELTDEAKVTVTVNPVNDAPTIKVDAVESITEDAVNTDTVVATLTVRDTDTPEDQLTVSLENNSNGYFVLVGNEVKLTQAGVDAVNNDELNLKDLTISASVSDGVSPTANDSDSLIVNRVNDAPTIDNVIADQVLAEDFDAYTIDLNEAFKDSDSSLEFSVSGNNNIQISIVNGVATITPTADWNGKETITFTAKDPSGESVSQTVNFTVAQVVDIEADSADVVEDTPTIINVLGNDTFEGDDKVVSLDTNNGPANGTVSVNPDGSVTYTPNDNYHGTDSFTYIVTSGGVSESTTVNVDVTPVNDAPVAKDDIATTQEDTAVTIDVLTNDNDVDGDKLSIESASVPKEQGTVEVVDGKLVFTPAENFNGDAEITYIVTDGQLADEAKVTVTVNPVNDAPTIKVDAVESITEDAVSTDTVVATLTVRDTDTPEDQLTVSLENNSNGYFVLVGNEVKLTQAGVDAVNNDELNLKDLTISASVSDGVNPTANDSDSLVVNRVNDAPTVDNVITDQVLSEDFDAYTIDLNEVFKDSDSSLEFSVSGNNNIQVSIVNGVATITPTADWNGKEAITFTAKDSSGESVSQTVNFTVAPVADIVADSATVVEDTPTIINVLGNDTFDGDDKIVSLDTSKGPANGTVSVNPDGSVTYTPNDNYHGEDTFTYIVTSGGVSESTIVKVDVTPVNDKPDSEDFTHVADDQLTHVVFDTDTKPLGSGDSQDHIADAEDDLKGNDLHVRITELPTSGTLFFKDSDGELHEIKEVSDTLYDKDSLYYEADNVGFLLGIKDRPNTPNSSESTTDFNNWGLSEDGGSSHSRTEHLANGASITISSDSGELAQYNRQVSHIGNGIADNDGQGIEKGETITIDLSNNPVGSVNLGLDGLGGLFDYGDDNAALITVTYLDSNNVQQTQTFEFLKPEGNFMLFQETSVGYGKELALPEGSVITQLDFSTKNEGNWELRYVEGVPAEDSFGYVAVDSESGVSDPSTVNIVNEMLDGNVAENGPSLSVVGDSVTEGDNVTFSVVLDEVTSTVVKYQVDMLAQGSSVDKNDVNLSNATYTNGVVFLGGYLIVPAGISSFEISIPTIDDLVVESSETIVLEIGGETGTATVLDNDSTELSVVDAGDVIEGTDAIFTVLLSNPVQEAVVVNLKSTTDDSYTAEDVDLGTMVVTYVDTHGQTQTLDMAPNGDVTIPLGVAEIKVAVPTKLDNVHEGDESFGLTVTEIGSVTSNGIATGNANIVDSDPAPLVSISADQNSVNEGETAGFTLTLDKVADESVTVDVEYSGVAQDGKDFVGVLSVEVPAGQSSAALDLLTLTDGIYEGAESFTVTIKEVDGADASIASNNSASVVIVDAQSAPKVTISSDQSSVDEGSDAKFIVNIDQ
ncbi:tandem-95 repeat protein, partial [Vibrio diabolicus]